MDRRSLSFHQTSSDCNTNKVDDPLSAVVEWLVMDEV